MALVLSTAAEVLAAVVVVLVQLVAPEQQLKVVTVAPVQVRQSRAQVLLGVAVVVVVQTQQGTQPVRAGRAAAVLV